MDGIVAFIVGTLIGVAIHSYIKKRIKELDEHPELNKNGKISQEQAEKYFKYFVVFLLLATFIIFNFVPFKSRNPSTCNNWYTEYTYAN